MPEPARYSVVVGHDIEKVAAPNQATKRDFDFEVPSGYVPLGPSRLRSGAILQFMAHPSDEPEGLFQFAFFINGNRVYRYGPSLADFVRSFIVTFGDSYLHPGTNTLTVERIGGTGALGLSSVVVWHQSAMTTTNPARRKPATSKTAPKRTARKPTKRSTKTPKRPTKRR
jgi:hypothetical protein